MFTGLIDDVGTIERVTPTADGRELTIRSRYTELAVGESVSVNGACLTVLDHSPGSFRVAAVSTTVQRTAIGTWRAGQRVNLERALRAGDRLGGHLVQGHVDGVATVAKLERDAEALLMTLTLPPDVRGLMVPRGSIAIDGVSLTVSDVPSEAEVRVSLIPHTVAQTTLGDRAAGDAVHVEADVVAKYIRAWTAPYLEAGAGRR